MVRLEGRKPPQGSRGSVGRRSKTPDSQAKACCKIHRNPNLPKPEPASKRITAEYAEIRAFSVFRGSQNGAILHAISQERSESALFRASKFGLLSAFGIRSSDLDTVVRLSLLRHT